MLPAAIKVPSPRPELTPARVASGLPRFPERRPVHPFEELHRGRPRLADGATARDWFARSPRRLSPVGGVGSLTMIGLGITVAATGRKG